MACIGERRRELCLVGSGGSGIPNSKLLLILYKLGDGLSMKSELKILRSLKGLRCKFCRISRCGSTVVLWNIPKASYEYSSCQWRTIFKLSVTIPSRPSPSQAIKSKEIKQSSGCRFGHSTACKLLDSYARSCLRFQLRCMWRRFGAGKNWDTFRRLLRNALRETIAIEFMLDEFGGNFTTFFFHPPRNVVNHVDMTTRWQVELSSFCSTRRCGISFDISIYKIPSDYPELSRLLAKAFKAIMSWLSNRQWNKRQWEVGKLVFHLAPTAESGEKIEANSCVHNWCQCVPICMVRGWSWLFLEPRRRFMREHWNGLFMIMRAAHRWPFRDDKEVKPARNAELSWP